MAQFELWINDVHRPLDARTPEQAVKRGEEFARRYRTPNVHEVYVMEVEEGQPPQRLATIRPWEG
jgi:hypothetical protein